MTTIRYDFSDSLEELRSRLVWRLCFVVIGFGIAGTWYLLVRRDLPFAASGLPLLVIALGCVIQNLANHNPILARHLLAWGLVVHLLIAMRIFPIASLPYMGIVCVCINAMLIKNGGLFTAISIFGAAALFNVIQIRAYSLLDLATMLALAAASSWLCAYTLFMVVHWYSAMQVHTQELLEVTRDHRAELTRTLKSLEIAYETQKHIQLELIWARKHADDARRLKEQFAANISHELRTPLSLILGFSETMYLAPEVYGDVFWSPTLRRDIHQIYLSSRHLLSMIDDILDLSRFEITGFDITLEAVPLETLLKDTIEIARDLVQGRPIRLDLTISTELPIVEIDRTRIRQVVLNLLNNACRFTETGIVELSAYQVEREVLVSISDTGPGIPSEKLPYLFDEFYQVDHSLKRAHGGVGLGLAISKRFIEAHGGRIWVESEERVGSRFTFALPLFERLDTHARTDRDNSPPLPEISRPCVLVIDKDAGVVSMLQHHLPDCDLVQVRDTQALREMLLMYHPRAIICNARPGYHDLDYQELTHSAVPTIECSLPSQAWTARNLPLAGCLTAPITAAALVGEIERVGQVQNILLMIHDRGFALLIERLLQADGHGKAFEVRRAYNASEGFDAITSRRPDLILVDSVILEMDLFSLLDRIEQDARISTIPIVLLTTNTSAEAIPRANQFIVRHPEGLYPIEIVHFIAEVIHNLKPRYYGGVATKI